MTLEVWKPNRQVRSIRPGVTLRIQAPASFRLRWSSDEWRTTQETHATATVLNIHFCDIPVAIRQAGSIRLTFFWIADERWESREYQIAILSDT